MAETRTKSVDVVGVRPRSEKTKERVAAARKLGLNVSDIVNDMMDDHFKDYLKRAIEKQANALKNAQVP